jgi:hypothetical protein
MVLIWLAFSCAVADAKTMYPGPPDDVPELINKNDWIESYNTDVEYRKRHDEFSLAIREAVDPARILVSRFTIAKFNLGNLLSDRSSNLRDSVNDQFRITPFVDLSLRFDVSLDNRLSELLAGNSVWTGTGKNHWDKYGDKDVDWQITMIIRDSAKRKGEKKSISIQMDSVEGILVVKPIESIIPSVPDEFRGLYLVINYDLSAVNDPR